YSATGILGNDAIFFHYQHEDTLDIDFLKSIILTFTDNGTGIDDNTQEIIKVYPNPTNETSTIETQNPEITSGKLYNSTGVFVKTLPIEQGINTYHIAELKSGIYFIELPQKESVVVKKLVKN